MQSIRSPKERTHSGEVVVKIKTGDKLVTGRGLSTNIIESSILAYLNGMNKILERRDSVAETGDV